MPPEQRPLRQATRVTIWHPNQEETTMTKIRSLFGALALTISAGMAQAQMLSITGHGENFALDYGSGHAGNIVGGGPVALVGGAREGDILYQDPSFAQRRAGVARDLGGESPLVYLPQVPASTMMTTR
jgi:hypothetical protein